MPRMTVKSRRGLLGLRLWFWHCPLCPDRPSFAFLSSSRCHDSARTHARSHWVINADRLTILNRWWAA